MFGRHIVTAKKLSPVFFDKRKSDGNSTENEGMIAHMFRHYADYYKKGISIILCPDTPKYAHLGTKDYLSLPYFSYDGNTFDQPGKPIKVDVHIDKSCGNILADPVQINQVMIHLVTNAYHAMEEDSGTLSIYLEKRKALGQKGSPREQEKNYICLIVKDTGMGIDPGILDKIFDLYFSTKKEGEGSGVGLSVVHGIVESHGGYIRVDLARKMSGIRPGLPIVICGGVEDILKEEQVESGSVRAVLNKPLDIKRLSLVLRQILDAAAGVISEKSNHKLTG